MSIVVVGQGYVGLPLTRGASRAGLQVIGLDRNETVVAALNSGVSHVDDISNEALSEMIRLGYVASSSPAVVSDADYVIVCVPTPLGDAGRPDLGAVEGAMADIAAHLKPGTTVILESTTYPGTTEDLVLPILKTSGLRFDEDFWLAFSPERIDPGNKDYGLENTPKVVGGISPKSTAKATEFYSQFVHEVVQVKGAKEAESAKLLENTYRHINIALVNEMVRFCHELGVDLWEVIDAAKTKPFGFQAFYPGPGVGGHCIPIDPSYLSYQVEKSLGYPFRFVELAEEINKSMPRYIVERIQDLLNEHGRALRGTNILLLGVAYKANIADQRESPALPLAKILHEKGARLSFHDPRVESWDFGTGLMKSETHVDEASAEADLVVLLQNHAEYDVDTLADGSKIFFDTRGVSSNTSSAIKL